MNDSSLLPSLARLKALRLELARCDLLGFTLRTKPDYIVNWHHRALCVALDRFVAGDIKRLMVFMPPRHGKSELVSRRLPAYILGRNPNAQIIACSYSADLAQRMNRDVQRIIDDPAYQRLFPGTQLFGASIRTVAQGTYLRNSDIFEVVGHRGTYRSAGVGGGITGMGFDFGIIDDPVKNRAEAESKTYREALWGWYTSTFYTRAEKDAAILVTCTRWHQDDLAGRLLEYAQSEDGDAWHVIDFPAVKESGGNPHDPREVGDPLWPDKYNSDRLAAIRAVLGSYQWSALYQQRPVPAEGALAQRQWFGIVDAVPHNARRVRFWDFAATEKKLSSDDPDFTAGVKMAYAGGTYYIEHVIQKRLNPGDVDRLVLQTAQADGQDVEIGIEQEPGASGKSMAAYVIRLLAGYNVRATPASGDKVTRAMPWFAQAQAGNVKLLRAPWNSDYLDEVTMFPIGAHDDMVDATSGAFGRIVAGGGPIQRDVLPTKFTDYVGLTA